MQAAADSRIVDNVVLFARLLRRAGLPVGPASVVDAVEALTLAGIGSRADLYWTLHAVFVTRRDHHPVFDEAFRSFWRARGLVQKLIAMLSPLSYIFVLTAMVFTPVSLVAPAREVSILFAALMGAHLLREGDLTRRVIAAAGMVLGIGGLALG